MFHSFLFFITLGVSTVSAFEMAPEYTFFHEEEATAFDNPVLLDGEYFSDVLTFKRQLSDPAQRWTLDNHYDLVLGSLSSREFLINQRLALRKNLSPNFEFRLNWFEDSDYEQNHAQITLELIYWIQNWGLAVNGSPSFYKSRDDVGVALLNRDFLGGEARIFAHFPDFQRNKRTQGTDSWIKSPLAVGFVSRSSSHEAAFRYERPLEWSLPAQQRIYNFKRSIVQLKKWFNISNTRILSFFLFHEHKFEGQTPSAASAVVADYRTRERSSLQVEWSQDVGSYDLKVGSSFNRRRYLTASEDFKIENWLPYAWLTLPWREANGIEQRWKLGVDGSFTDTSDPALFLIEPVDTFAIHSRVNVVYELRSLHNWSLNFLFTFDSDMQNSDTLWEGGAGQLRIYF